jgi:phosphoglycolate phosphatase-like HAD superfamily hydrolase
VSHNGSIDLIVTDLGGTLVKTDGAIMAAVRRAAAELAIPEGYSDPVYDVFGTSIWEYIHAYLPEGHKDRTNDTHQRFWTLFPYEVLAQITPFAGVEEALHDLKRRGVRLAVLSGLRLESIERILSTLSFQDWDAVRSSMLYSTAAGDSRALGIAALVKEFGVSLGRTIYIGAANAGGAPQDGAQQGGLWRTRDGGATWRKVIQKGPEHFGAYLSPHHRGWIYATLTEGAPGSGLWLSRDDGGTWAGFEDLPFRNIQRVEFDPRDPSVIYLATFGGSVWRGPAEPARTELPRRPPARLRAQQQ